MGITTSVTLSTFEIIIGVLYGLGVMVAFLIGVKEVCLKKSPLYFKLLVFAIGCFSLEGISSMVDGICSGEGTLGRLSLSLSTIAYYLFIASANWGQIDGLVDEKTAETKKASLIAILFPVVSVVIHALLALTAVKAGDITIAVEVVLLGISLSVGGYFALKHLLLPMDQLGIKTVTKRINIAILIEYAMELLYDLALLLVVDGSSLAADIFSVLILAAVIYLSIEIIRGSKAWKTLV